MENILKDKRFTCLFKDPKFRKIPKSEHKIKIDERFKLMFKDKKFAVKYTIDKRGRPVNQTSSENLKKYYNISSDDDSPVENLKSNVNKSVFVEQKLKKSTSDIEANVIEESQENFLTKDSIETNLEKNEKKKHIKKNRKILQSNIDEKLQQLSVDYARGKGILLSNTSSDDESSDYEDEEKINHIWGELDNEIETTNDITHRLAVCNMNWDRIRAIDLMVLFNSFLPTGGLLISVTIYPSKFGLERMKDEEIKGPIELRNCENKKFNEIDKNNDSETESLRYNMEKLREYQLNRLKYYYGVIIFDSANTANKIYTECDGLEYESSSTKLDLRFIPDNMIFDEESKEFCNELPDLVKYKPRQFITTALQQCKVNLTWDETNPERQEITQKLLSKKFDDLDKNDIQAYLANGSSEDEVEDQVKKQLEKIECTSSHGTTIDKYKLLLNSIKQAEEDTQNREIALEFTWGLDVKKKTDKVVKEKSKKTDLTPFQQYLDKLKTRKVIKKKQKRKNYSEDNVVDISNLNHEFINRNVNNSNFSEKLNIQPKLIKQKDAIVSEDFKNKEKIEQSQLELLLMDENEESNKFHFNMKTIELESLKKLKKKNLRKRRKDLKKDASKDEFEIDVRDSRFNALFTSHHYNIDPADPHYRKTKGTDALIQEKLKRRIKSNSDIRVAQNTFNEERNCTHFKINTELNALIKSIKRNSQKFEKPIK
ncbi:PREDICTED: ESF1 homolog [Ceratosolen solmsi marchali]|uniref:ESF1 homolog n=1 Tax=Ceratosolen solmsi marchali TaxID=326594 RepID=A0AAJ7DUQ3_9HYME|nr:PREDICTED: ESF1 homolog [Ceratosolen solmsi marchali]